MRYLVFLGLLVFPYYAKGQDSNMVSHYPSPTVWEKNIKPEVSYDKFSDSTTVLLRLWPYASGGFLANTFRDVHQIIVSYTYPGKMRPDSILAVTLVAVGERIPKENPADTSMHGELLFLANDKERFRFDGIVRDNRSPESAYVVRIPTNQFIALASAAKLECRAGRTEISFDQKSLEALRNFAARMAPGVSLY